MRNWKTFGSSVAFCGGNPTAVIICIGSPNNPPGSLPETVMLGSSDIGEVVSISVSVVVVVVVGVVVGVVNGNGASIWGACSIVKNALASSTGHTLPVTVLISPSVI